MSVPFTPPRQVRIGDAAAFVGTTARAIRHYHQIGLLPEPERGSDDRRRYGYEDMIRLLWIRKMADAGIPLDDIRDAFAGTSLAGAEGDHDVEVVLVRLESTLAARAEELQRQRAAVQRMRTRGSRAGLLSDVVTDRLKSLPEGSLRQADLDSLLVMERIFGPLGAALNATRFIALATHPGLREQSDRVEVAEEALDDTVAVDDPRVAQVAAARHALELALYAVIESSGLAQDEEALLDSWDALRPDPDPAGGGEDDAARGSGGARISMGLVDGAGRMPYDWSPARLRCIELTEELATREPPAP
ncbi:MerR family transcriptional regulator [Pseudokineococcus marinus]|uniref:MerR family transcriptional regulator n=1 Tax=Pseudokineococcus marinus TaxID=351215 RepID=A0A849BND3_9ACTN|nr:MerR family transcriptional regulator [Pseudokineococcus marinus]NNH22104.1 MerR family transcriptional regulator [Pseudokineococcus marinus]